MTNPRLFLCPALAALFLAPGFSVPFPRAALSQEATVIGGRLLEVAPGMTGFEAVGRGQQPPDATDRIWGRVRTTSGEVYQGFIRWDRNEGSWADLLDGSKGIDWESFEEWTVWEGSDRPRTERAIEIAGYRITWDDQEPDFVSTAESGIRFGHIHRLRVVDEEAAELELRSGEVVELSGGSTDLGTDMRELLVEDPEGGVVEVSWSELEEVRFGPAPASARPRGGRLHGTVEDRWGHHHTGYIAWGRDKIFATDTLEGEEGGERREILFERVSAIERVLHGTEVTLGSGQGIVLTGSRDVDVRNRGLLISDPGLGMIEVDWSDFASVRFHDPAVPVPYGAFDGGHRLRGTVVTRTGEELTGWIRWDADEEYSWEILDGTWEDVVFDVEFGNVAVIERVPQATVEVAIGMGASVDVGRDMVTRVTLTDGRVLELEGSNDVDEENKGIFVEVGGGSSSALDRPTEGRENTWVLVRWDDFQQLRFEH
ncbi:hypothetical protein ACFL3S_12425 [Gemmatimonadota bacterium]